LSADAIAAGNLSPADVFQLEAFYSGDPNYTAGHSTTVPTPPARGTLPGGDSQLSVRDTGMTFFNFFHNASGNVVTPLGSAQGVVLRGKRRPSADLGAAHISSATGGNPGHFKFFIDGKQFKTASGANSTPTFNSVSGTFSLTKTGIAPTGMHTIVIQYLGDGVDGFLPPGSTTIVFTAPLVAGHNALVAPKGSVAFSTAPKSPSSTTDSSGGLSDHGVDNFFASTTTQHTPRTLAGALSKVHSGDDWLGGVFQQDFLESVCHRWEAGVR
jgi:hypothetical protein